MSQGHDYNLLFGIIALQMDFVQREQLVAATSAWLTDKSRRLDEILVEQGSLKTSDRDLLSPLVERHLENHGGDAARSLSALSSIGSVADDLRSLGDDQIEATLSIVSTDSVAAGAESHFARPGESETRFRVLRPHAKGGLGEVSVAKDIELNRDVALKEIQERYADDEASRSRFLLEAEVTGGLEHPGIVPVYGLGRYDDGRPFYAMRFIKGDSLQEAAERMYGEGAVDYSSVEFRKLLGRFIDVCEAIEYAHSRGVLHRDLKPGNIMLGKYGETLVVDWGLAKLKGREDVSESFDEQTLRPSSASGSAPTQMGSAIGTPAFMPPEQALGALEQLGPASDVYSLGATLYYVLTAQRPFTAGKLPEVLEAVKRGDFRAPRTVKPAVPKPLEAICLKAMSLKQDERYASPMKLADDVQRWLGDEPVGAYEEPITAQVQRWIRRNQTLAASFTALLFAGLVALAVSTALIGKAQQETADALVKEKAARTDADTQRDIADRKRKEADDQREIAEQALRENRRISANLAFDRARELSESGKPDIGLNWYVRAMELAPDGDEAFHELIRENLSEWSAKIITRTQHFKLQHGGYPAGARMSEGGKRLFICHPDIGVIEWNTGTAEPKLLPFPGVAADAIETPTPGGIAEAGPVALSPDDRVCAAAVEKKLYFWNTVDGSLRGEPVTVENDVMALGFHPAGRLLAVGCGNGACHFYDLDTNRFSGEAVAHGARIAAVDFAPDGETLLTAGHDATVRRWEVSTHKEAAPAFKHERAGLSTATWSPDGKRIFAGDLGGLVVWEVASGESVFDLRTDGGVLAINFSPDGRQFAFGVEDGTVRVWDADLLTPLHHALLHNDSPYFVAFGETSEQLFTLAAMPVLARWRLPRPPLATTDVQEVDSNRIAVGPTGRKVAFGAMRGNFTLSDVATGEPIGRPLDFEEPVASVAFNRSGSLVLVTGFRGASRVYETQELKQIGETIRVEGMAMAGSFVDDQHVAIASMQEGVIRVFDIMSAKAVGNGMEQFLPARMDVFDGKLIASGLNKQIKSWDLESRVESMPTIEDVRQVLALRYSPDGELFAAGGIERAAAVWRTGSPEPLMTLPHRSAVKEVSFSAGNRLLATSGADDTVRLWHLKTGKRVGPFRKEDNLTQVRFVRDDSILLVTQVDGQTAKILTWPRPARVSGDTAALRLWASVETGLELQADGNHRVLPWEDWNELAAELNQLPPVVAE